MRKGFTLVELLIVIAILIVMTTIMIGTLNPGILVGKGNDTKRKKDLGRIKVAFEEYFNDKQCYPDNDLVISENIASNCGKNVFGLNGWPCDPATRQPYKLVTQAIDCPRYYKIFAKLDNPNDKDIPINWSNGYKRIGNGEVVYTENDVNYGVSSDNVSWDERMTTDRCVTGATCNRKVGAYGCQAASSGCVTDLDSGVTCYITNNDCVEECQVNCCGASCQ